jgi:SnoaL-like domain
MPSAQQLIDAYCAAWNEPVPAARTEQLEAVLAQAARYTDPRADVRGAAGLSAHIGTIRATRPGSRVIRTTAIDRHHDIARFGFRVVSDNGTELLHGLDIIELTEGGRIARIIGFFGSLADA